MTTTPIDDELAAVLDVAVAEDVERVVDLAWQEAADLGHRGFGTGHLLLGVVRAGGPEAGLLAAAGVTAGTASAALDLIAGHSVSEPVEPCATSAPVAEPTLGEVLADASRAALADGRSAVGALDLLGALVRRRWGQSAEMLAALDVPVADLADAVRALAAPGVPPVRPATWRDPSRLLTSAHRPAPHPR